MMIRPKSENYGRILEMPQKVQWWTLFYDNGTRKSFVHFHSYKHYSIFRLWILTNFDKFEPKIAPNLSNYQNVEQFKSVKSPKRSTWSIFRRIWHWFESVKSSKRMHIRPHDDRLFRTDFVKTYSTPRTRSDPRTFLNSLLPDSRPIQIACNDTLKNKRNKIILIFCIENAH